MPTKREITTAVRRLRKLAELIRPMKRARWQDKDDVWVGDFLMEIWGQKKDGSDTAVRKLTHCRTVGCIGGWATAVNPNLRLNKYGNLSNTLTDSIGDCAFADAFHLDLLVAARLTDQAAPHQTPKAAARAIERVVKNLETESLTPRN